MAIFSKNRSILLIYKKINIHVNNKHLTNFSKRRLSSLKAHDSNFSRLKNESYTKQTNKIICTQIRYQSQQETNSNEETKRQPFLKTGVLYSLSIVLGGMIGVITGYWLTNDHSQTENINESVRPQHVYESTKSVSF